MHTYIHARLLIPQGQNVTLYEVAVRKASPLPLSPQQASFLSWSKTGPQLAIGTTKGNLVLYNKSTRKRVPITGLHSKKIVSGAWNVENKLALTALDRMVSVSDAEGNTLEQTVCADPRRYVGVAACPTHLSGWCVCYSCCCKSWWCWAWRCGA
jgi:WD repeat-containing protein 19